MPVDPRKDVQKIAGIVATALDESGITISAENGTGTWFEVALGDGGYVQITIAPSGGA